MDSREFFYSTCALMKIVEFMYDSQRTLCHFHRPKDDIPGLFCEAFKYVCMSQDDAVFEFAVFEKYLSDMMNGHEYAGKIIW